HDVGARDRWHSMPRDPAIVEGDVFHPLAVDVNGPAVVTRKPLDLLGDAALCAMALIEERRDHRHTQRGHECLCLSTRTWLSPSTDSPGSSPARILSGQR